MVTRKSLYTACPAQGVTLADDRSTAVQLILTMTRPGNGLCSVRVVTWAAKSPVFATAKVQVTVWPVSPSHLDSLAA